MTRSEIEQKYYAPGAYWRGNEYVTLNPSRADKHIGSFSVNTDGYWYDFAIGEGGRIGKVQDIKVPMEYITTDEILKIKGEYVTPYYDHDGHVIFVVKRTEDKKIYPLSKHEGKIITKLPHNLELRPMLPLQNVEWPILIVEGEKCYHEALRFMEYNKIKMNITTWHGGANIAISGKIDLYYVYKCKNRRVLLWPDNDLVGKSAMRSIAERLIDNFEVGFIQIPIGVPGGWDIADAIVEKQNIIELLKIGASKTYKTRDELLSYFNSMDPLEVNKIYTLSDLGNSERFSDMWRGRALYNMTRGEWYVWDGKVWGENPARLTGMVEETIDRAYEEHEDKAMGLEQYNSIQSMLKLSAVRDGMYANEEDFDNDPFIVVCRNGVVDLRTGELLPHSEKRLVSRYIDLDYQEGVIPEKFYMFLYQIMMKNYELIDFLQRWFGLSLSGDTSNQSFCIFYGTGANGKSTLVDTIYHVLGSYAAIAPYDTLIEKKFGSGIPNDLAGMNKARCILASETASGAKLDEAKIKSMTGGEPISARFMRGEFFTFKPQWKITLSTNHKPRISSTDYGIWRRVLLVPFLYTVRREDMDPMLSYKLLEEAPAILSWMVEGAVKYFKDGAGPAGLKIPKDIIENTEEYRNDENVFSSFVEECCYTEEYIKQHYLPDRVLGTLLYKVFIKWAEKNNESWAKISNRRFYTMVQDNRYQIVKSNERYIMGLYPKEVLIEENYY